MKNYFIYILLFFVSCGYRESKIERYSSYYRLTASNLEKHKLDKENGVFMFYDKNAKDKKKPLMLGTYVDGFRNGFWEYQGEGDSIKLIKWAYYKDQHMDIETNLFQEIDTCTYGNDYSTLIFNTNREKIKFTIALNSEIIKKIKGDNYIQLLAQEFKKVDAEIVSFTPIKLREKSKFVAYSIVVKKYSNTSLMYLYSAYAKMKNGITVDFAIQTTSENSFYAKILFDAVISNIYVKKERVYSPWDI